MEPAPPPGPEVASITLADTPEAWAAAGFAVDSDGTCRLGSVRLVLAGPGGATGVTAWSLRDLPDGAASDLDGGLATTPTTEGPVRPAEHPCSAVAVDHLVLLTDDIDRTVAAAATVGLTPRRWRDHALPDGTAVRQVFFRVGEPVLEVVAPAEAPAVPRLGVRSFGLAVTVTDLAAAAEVLGDALGEPRPAVQRGRAIATMRGRTLGLGTPLALMTPPPAR